MKDVQGFVGGTPEDGDRWTEVPTPEPDVRHETDHAEHSVVTYRIIGHADLHPSRQVRAASQTVKRIGDLIAGELETHLRDIGVSGVSIRLIPLVEE